MNRMPELECKECKRVLRVTAFYADKRTEGVVRQPCINCMGETKRGAKKYADGMFNPKDKRWDFYKVGITHN